MNSLFCRFLPGRNQQDPPDSFQNPGLVIPRSASPQGSTKLDRPRCKQFRETLRAQSRHDQGGSTPRELCRTSQELHFGRSPSEEAAINRLGSCNLFCRTENSYYPGPLLDGQKELLINERVLSELCLHPRLFFIQTCWESKQDKTSRDFCHIGKFQKEDLHPGEQHSHLTQDDCTVTLCTLRTASVTQLLCRFWLFLHKGVDVSSQRS